MNARGMVAAILVSILAVICCAGLPLIAAIGTSALAAWLSYSGYLLIAISLIAVVSAVLLLRYHRVRLPAKGTQKGIKA